MLLATASQAAFDRSSSGSRSTWLRTPTRPFSRRQPITQSSSFRLGSLATGVLKDGASILRPLTGVSLPFTRVKSATMLMVFSSPALGLDIVDVHMLALLDRGDGFANVLTVFPNRVPWLYVRQRHLVTDRNVLLG